jgi:hypothetical protein
VLKIHITLTNKNLKPICKLKLVYTKYLSHNAFLYIEHISAEKYLYLFYNDAG